jgi:Hint domain
VRDEPFVPGYTSAAFSYFSWNGQTVTLPFENPADVASGSDVADWDPAITGDAFGDGPSGFAETISTTDKRELSVLGYNAIACFAAGTRILTASGPRTVEALAPGDEVRTALGGPGRIIWVGQRSFDSDRHPHPEQIWPVRIARDAFGPGSPERALFLSPDHAVYVDGALIPIKLLMNGATIRQVPRRRVTYYHIELAAHDIILADGLPAESYLDTGNRTIFRDAEKPTMLHPNFLAAQAEREALSCARLVTAADELEPVWRALSRRATSLGWPAQTAAPGTADPGLCLVTAERRIAPAGISDCRFDFVVPSDGAPLRLVSRSARPIDAMPWTGDQRRLGVKIRRLILARGREVREIAIDDPSLTRGWWQVERDPSICRWTNGDALLPPLVGVLTVELAGTMRYQTEIAAPPNVPLAA